MANNRLWLVHKETGNAICIAKSLGGGYYPIHNEQNWQEYFDNLYLKHDLSGYMMGDDMNEFIVVDDDYDLDLHINGDWV